MEKMGELKEVLGYLDLFTSEVCSIDNGFANSDDFTRLL